MGIRSKLLLPLILLGASFASILHLYWLPKFLASEAEDLRNRELAHLEVLAAGLVPSLLSGDLAQIHATMEQLAQRQRGWKAIYLKTLDGRFLYPITPTPVSDQPAAVQRLQMPVSYEGNPIANLELRIDTNSVLAPQIEKIHSFEHIMLLLMLAVTALAALLQDRWIRRPLETLVTATSRIAQGDYAQVLPKGSDDEVGKLVNAFSSMSTTLEQRGRALKCQHQLLSTITSVQSQFIRDSDTKTVFDGLLSHILSLTTSEYGFIGEVLYRDDKPYLRTFAISNIAWDDKSRNFYAEHAPSGMEFTKLDTLFGAAIKTGDPVIANQPASDPRSGGTPDGHPQLTAFLGIPFLRGDRVIGMFGIANRPEGYDEALVEFLEPITATCTQIIEAAKAERQRVLAEDQLRERETRMRTLFENVIDGIITTDETGIIESFNHAAEQLFGYSSEEALGQNVSILTPVEHHDRHDGYIKHYLNGHESRIIGTGREVEGRRKDGSLFPVEVAVTEMWVGEKRLFCSIMRDITERKKIDRMKNEFVSTVSHELRTPLTSIRGSLGLLVGGAAGQLPVQAQSLLEIASNNTERLLLLINDILDIEKIESGEMAFKFKSVPVGTFLKEALKANDAYASQHNVRLELHSTCTSHKVYADADRLMQVMNNLLSNAIKFSREGSTVDVTETMVEDRIRISVTDHGPGIPEAFQGKVFDKFTQSDSSDTRSIGGTGLGLNITKAIVEKHGGYIDFVTQENIGTTFFFELPVLPALDGNATIPVHAAGAHGGRILVVEDDADVAALLRMMVAQAGFSADIAEDAKQAKQRLKESSYEAITLDIMLPDQDGISLVRELREQDETKAIPVVIVSAKADIAQHELHGRAFGVVDWLNKPIDQSRLMSAINQLMVSEESPIVLHVEDDPDVHVIVSELLKQRAKVVWARTLKDARQQLADNCFDLVLLDIGLPDGSGITLLDQLNQCATPVPTVMFSASDVDESIADRVNASLLKSSTRNEDLVETILSLLPATHREATDTKAAPACMEVDTHD
jgi:PAS domain S-box-containing protein